MKQQIHLRDHFGLRPMILLQRMISRRNATLLLRLFLGLTAVVTTYSLIFHVLMLREQKAHSLLTGFYWTFSTMGLLGLGDVAFTSDLGRMFTVLVMLTGILFFMVLLPFSIIQLFQSTARIPRELPEGTRGHMVLAGYGPLTAALVERMQRYRHSYVVLMPDIGEAMRLRDMGVRTVHGELDDPATYRELRIDQASLVVTTDSDVTNTTLAYSVRSVSREIPIIATASGRTAAQVLEEAGCTHVLTLDEMMGQSLARRIVAGDAMAHIIGQVDDLVIAEAAAAGTPLIGRTIAQAGLDGMIGLSVIGVWTGGVFALADPGMIITAKNVLVLAGTLQQIETYNELFCIYNISSAPILIIGGGAVGRAVGRALRDRDLDHRIIERNAALVADAGHEIAGDGGDIRVLNAAGFYNAPAVAITTHDDPVNIYLSTYYRHLRKDVQIISRATSERSIPTLYRAGSDFVVSRASLGANSIFNLMKRENILTVAEGVDVFRVHVPKALAGRRLGGTAIRQECGCALIGMHTAGEPTVVRDPEGVLSAESDIILIGDAASEERFFRRYGPGGQRAAA